MDPYFLEPVLPSIQHILVVEDNIDNAYLVEVTLQNSQHVIDVVYTGKEGLSFCQKKQYNIVILDLHLPDMLGEHVAFLLRKMPHYETVPLVAYTAREHVDEEVQCLFSLVLIKPVLSHRLREAIHMLLHPVP